MRTFTSNFETARNKTAHAPVNLLKIEFPAVLGNAARTYWLADRALTVGAQDYVAAVEGWGDIDALLDIRADQSAPASVGISLINARIDFGFGLERISELFATYPPESATATLYQWFADDGLGGGDLVPLLKGSIEEPISFDEQILRFDIVALGYSVGKTRVGRTLTLDDFPSAPPSSIGRIIPIVLGAVDGVPGIPLSKAVETLVKSSSIEGASVIEVESTAEFPSAGTLVVDDIKILYTGKTATTFTGCSQADSSESGVRRNLYAKQKIYLDAGAWEYLFCDPRFPVKSIGNLKSGGQPVSGGSVDLGNCKVTFPERPKKLTGHDSAITQFQFDAVDPANTAQNPAAAYDVENVTTHAAINQLYPKLAIRQTGELADRGTIKKAYLSVEHFEEEKLPNDSLRVSLSGLGVIGYLKKPHADDQIRVGGETDITHNHLETIGGTVNIEHGHGNNIGVETNATHGHGNALTASSTSPAHGHPNTATTPEKTQRQSATNGVGAWKTGVSTLSFPPHDSSLGTPVRADYSIKLARGLTGDAISPIRLLNDPAGTLYEATNGGTVRIFYDDVTVSTFGFYGTAVQIFANSITSYFIESASRTLYYSGQVTVPSVSPSVNTTLSGGITGFSGTLPGAVSGGVANLAPTTPGLNRSGGITAVTGNKTASITTKEKSSRAVIEYFDITAHVNGDWSWFKDRVAEIEYVGSSDGRHSFIIHVAFEVEYAVPKYEPTDEVTADIEGVRDDASGSVTGTANALIERPDHVFKWSLFNLAGLAAGDLDATSYAEAGTAFSGLAYKCAGLVDVEQELRALWRELGAEFRCVHYFDHAGQSRLQVRPLNSSDSFVQDKAITESMIRLGSGGAPSLKAERTPSKNVINRVVLRYAYDYAQRNHTKTETRTDSMSESVFGTRESPSKDFSFNFIRDTATAGSVAEYYLREYAWPSTIVTLEAFLDNMEIEQGDMVALTADLNAWTAAPCLVLEAGRALGSGKAGKMDAVRLKLKLFPIKIARFTYPEIVRVAESFAAVLRSFTGENIAVAEAVIAVLRSMYAESISVSEAMAFLLGPRFSEGIGLGEVQTSLHRAMFPEGVASAELGMIQGGPGYGRQSYGDSGYGGLSGLNEWTGAPYWEYPAVAEVLRAVFAHVEVVGVAEAGLLSVGAGYGLAPYSLEGYGGTQTPL